MMSRVGVGFQATFQSKAWTLKSERRNQIIIWIKETAEEWEDKALKKEENEKVPDEEGNQSLKLEREGEGWM